jgi:hypothetical protein
MMIKRGYHRLRTAEGRVVEGPLVVVTSIDGHFLSYHLLLQEEEATEWVGGEFQVSDNVVISL